MLPGAYAVTTIDRPSPWRKVKPGDRLWVRESVRAVEDEDLDRCVQYEADRDLRVIAPSHDNESDIFGKWFNLRAYRTDDPDLDGGKITPSIHMPRWASSLTLEVTATKIERLQDIGEGDAIAEGCAGKLGPNPDFPDEWDPSPQEEFSDLWRSLHGSDSWSANPEVVALTFTVHKTNIDQMVPA
jgi:hypothetical protein